MRKIGVQLVLAGAVLLAGLVTSRATAAVIASDDFNRADSDSLGVTPVGGYSWAEVEPTGPGQIAINSAFAANKAFANSRGSGTDPAAYLAGLSVADVVLSVDLTSQLASSNNYFGGLAYRRPNTTVPMHGNTGGYSVDVTAGAWDGTRTANSVSLRWANTTILSVATIPTTIVQGTEYNLSVVAWGNNHKVYFDNLLLINFDETTSGRDSAGNVGFGTYYGNWSFDNFTVSEVPEPTFFAPMAFVGLAMLRRRHSDHD